ncbi:MAG: FkbM family methyltransferase, partial [Christensenellaceae bacterium]
MLELDRIDYRGLDKDTILNRIDWIGHMAQAEKTAEQARSQTVVELPRQKGLVERAKDKAKRVVKKTPFGRLVLSKRNRETLRAAYTDMTKPAMDLTPLFGLEDKPFLEQAIRILFRRDIQKDECYGLMNLMKQEFTKASILYILLSSSEADRAVSIEGFERYEQEYVRIRRKVQIKNLPVINYIVALAVMPMRAKAIEERMVRNEIDDFLYQEETNASIARHTGAVIGHMNEWHITTQNELRNHMSHKIGELIDWQEKKMEEIMWGQVKKVEDMQEVLLEAQHREATAMKEGLVALSEKTDRLYDLMESNTGKHIIPSFQGGITVVDTGAMQLGVPAEDWKTAALLAKYGHLEIGTEKFIQRFVKKGMTVVDIGANLGVMSILMAQNIGDSGKLYSFEPSPKVFEIMQNNLALNGFEGAENIVLLNKAVADREGEIRFREYETSGHSSIYDMDEKVVNMTKVKMTDLDSVLAGQAADLIKIDVEGAEPLVLKGMQKTIKNSPNLHIIMEFAPSILKK